MIPDSLRAVCALDGLRIALERIAREADEKTGFLDLGCLGLGGLPDELFNLKHLCRLNLGSRYFDEKGKWRDSASSIGENSLKTNIKLFQLPNLELLWLISADLSDFTGLSAIARLRSLYCSSTQVSDVAWLRGLPNLQTLDCSHTQVSDLAPLGELPNVQTLNCSQTHVSDLAPLSGLSPLQTLICSRTQVSDLTPLSGLPSLQTLICSRTQVSDLAPLNDSTSLQTLNCSLTQVSDLAPLSKLSALQTVNCSQTQVSDLAPLSGLSALQTLDCSETQVSNLAPLNGLTNLQWLSCAETQVSDLAPLKRLANLQTFNCSLTQVSDLAPLRGLPNLQTLWCSKTQVSDLAPLKRLANLQALFCPHTRVSDLAPLNGLTNLQTLFCADTHVKDLAPLSGLPNLQLLDCARCELTPVPDSFWSKPSLVGLFLHETRIPLIPAEVLSQWEYENCLVSLRAHLGDLAKGQEVIPDVKLMILGNGRIGKTQICRQLRGESYDIAVESTHGIMVTSASLAPTQEGAQRLQIWDFGGQDIYHGTHALFMRSRAIFAVVWIPEAEKTPEHRHGEFVFRNQPLAYWLEYIRHFGGAESPIVIIQTRCDEAENEQARPPVSDDALNAFRPVPKLVQYSARTNRGRPSLDDALSQSVEWLRNREGVAIIGAGRAKVKRQIEAMRDADATRAPLEREHRTISHEHFMTLCSDAGGISEPKQLLNYLHNAGTIFYREGLFENRIILDQGWALESIYAIFHREKCYRKLARQKGRFTRTDLDEWIWHEAGHGTKEQELLISMMQSCGICFQHRRASELIEAEYIAPDLLPEKTDSGIEQKWDSSLTAESAEFEYSLLPSALMRGIISRIGGEAGLDADYWRDGVYIYEATTGSRGLIEQKTTGLWQGRIQVQTQRGQAAQLLERLVKLVEEEQSRVGITSPTKVAGPPIRPAELDDSDKTKPPQPEPALKFVQESTPQPEYFVSYAWGDSSPEGRDREHIVDELCTVAERKRDITILRDKKVVGLGERVSKFMQRLGRGGRVFVVLSDKYLKSPFCMYELFEVWRNCRQDDEEFLSRIRVYALPDAKIWSPFERAQCAVHWKQESARLEALVSEHGYDILGQKDYQHYKMMKDFSRHIGDILTTVTDILQPRTFEEFEKYGLSE